MFLTFGGRRLFAPATFPPRVDLTTHWPHSLAKPSCSRRRRNRSRQRARVGPMLPMGIFNSLEMSLYLGGSSVTRNDRNSRQRGFSRFHATRTTASSSWAIMWASGSGARLSGKFASIWSAPDRQVLVHRTNRRHSLRAVVASHPPMRSGCSMRCRFSTSRSHVVCSTSAMSARSRPKRRPVAAIIPLNRATSSSQAPASPSPALSTRSATGRDWHNARVDELRRLGAAASHLPGSSRSGPDRTPPQGCDGAWLTDTA